MGKKSHCYTFDLLERDKMRISILKRIIHSSLGASQVDSKSGLIHIKFSETYPVV